MSATAIECCGCGRRLAVPADVGEGGAFVCGGCGLILRNVQSARDFRWAQLDPYVRRHGVSRLNFWGGLLGSSAWIVLLFGVLLTGERFDLVLALALTVPWTLMLGALYSMRARTPAALWLHYLFASLGIYLVYLRALLVAVPAWGELLAASGAPAGGPASAAALHALLRVAGIALVVLGGAGVFLYRARARRLPRAAAAPGAEP